jgi:hypothetical protein
MGYCQLIHDSSVNSSDVIKLISSKDKFTNKNLEEKRWEHYKQQRIMEILVYILILILVLKVFGVIEDPPVQAWWETVPWAMISVAITIVYMVFRWSRGITDSLMGLEHKVDKLTQNFETEIKHMNDKLNLTERIIRLEERIPRKK